MKSSHFTYTKILDWIQRTKNFFPHQYWILDSFAPGVSKIIERYSIQGGKKKLFVPSMVCSASTSIQSYLPTFSAVLIFGREIPAVHATVTIIHQALATCKHFGKKIFSFPLWRRLKISLNWRLASDINTSVRTGAGDHYSSFQITVEGLLGSLAFSFDSLGILLFVIPLLI